MADISYGIYPSSDKQRIVLDIDLLTNTHSASHDILRLYDLKGPTSSRSTVPFRIVPGHMTGVVSQLYIDPACRFMISTGGNRGWEGQSTEVLLGYEIGCIN